MYDRKTWIILAVCGALLATNYYFGIQNQKASQAQRAEQEAIEKANAPQDPVVAANAGLAVEPPPPPTEEQTVVIENDKVAFTLTNIGGGIKHAEFKEEFEVGSLTQRVRVNRFGSGPIGALADSDQSLENTVYGYKPEDSIAGKKAVYLARLPSGLIAKKTFSLVESDKPGSPYLLDLQLDVQVHPEASVALNLNQWSVFLGEASPLYQSEVPQQTGFFWREDGTMHFNEVSKFKGGWFGSDKNLISSPAGENIEYAGITNQFFSTVLRPKEPLVASVWAKPDLITLHEGERALSAVRAGLQLPTATLNPGESRSIAYHLFIGPKHNPMLRKMESAWGEGWGSIMQYGWFSPVSRFLNWLLNTYHNILDGVAKNWSWGLAIILLTITVRTLIWPLHAKSTHTMKRMSKLQPEIAKLKEKYPDDPNKLNTEMMGLYRKYGINPLGGCLPMLIQIPIFFGFYRMLQYAVELRHQGFLWVSDLSQPDTLTHIAGIPINVLPIVMGITSFLQIAMMPKTGDKMQQRIMLLMPLIFFFFCYNFASALALYWTTQNIFSIGQTWLMSKVPEPELKARKDGGKKSWVQRMAERQAEMQRQREAGGSNPAATPAKKKRTPRTGG